MLGWNQSKGVTPKQQEMPGKEPMDQCSLLGTLLWPEHRPWRKGTCRGSWGGARNPWGSRQAQGVGNVISPEEWGALGVQVPSQPSNWGQCPQG